MNTSFYGILNYNSNIPKISIIMWQFFNQIQNVVNKHTYYIGNIIFWERIQI